MVNNQIEFNNEYSKEEKEIEIKYEEFEEKWLVIENYSELEKLYLQNVENLDKITLKGLHQLKECTIWDCGLKELVIENCPQISKLNIENNLLTNLGFIKDLKNLEELKINGNAELIEILSPYYNKNCLDWKIYQKVIQGSSENIQGLLKIIRDLKEKVRQLEEERPVIIDNPLDFEKKYQNLKKFLGFLSTEEKKKTEEINLVKTDELKKEIGNKLSSLKKANKELKEKLTSFEQIYLAKKQSMEQKEKGLEELKNNYLAKNGSYDKEKLKNYLEKLLKVQVEITQINSNIATERKEEIKAKLIKKTLISNDDLDNFCQLQVETTQLRLEIQKSFNQTNQIFHINSVGNYIENYAPYSGSTTNFLGSQEIRTIKPQEFNLENKVEMLPKNQS